VYGHPRPTTALESNSVVPQRWSARVLPLNCELPPDSHPHSRRAAPKPCYGDRPAGPGWAPAPMPGAALGQPGRCCLHSKWRPSWSARVRLDPHLRRVGHCQHSGTRVCCPWTSPRRSRLRCRRRIRSRARPGSRPGNSRLTACTPRRGDIVYWAPRNALALFYGDGDEQFADIQVVGRVDSGMDAVDHPGNVTATFSLPANT